MKLLILFNKIVFYYLYKYFRQNPVTPTVSKGLVRLKLLDAFRQNSYYYLCNSYSL